VSLTIIGNFSFTSPAIYKCRQTQQLKLDLAVFDKGVIAPDEGTEPEKSSYNNIDSRRVNPLDILEFDLFSSLTLQKAR
jgi:hypothetical protein